MVENKKSVLEESKGLNGSAEGEKIFFKIK
jgi:hypothetical protein